MGGTVNPAKMGRPFCREGMRRSAFLCVIVALMLSGAAFADGNRQAANKKTLVAFHEAAINQKNNSSTALYAAQSQRCRRGRRFQAIYRVPAPEISQRA